MEIQSIDLIGPFSINGITASQGKVIQSSNGQLGWGTASVSAGEVVKTSGYNYIIVKTVNTGDPTADAITNGDSLYTAYSDAKLLDVGGLSPTNRITILLSPGTYNFANNAFYLDTAYIDLVGMSPNARHTILFDSVNNHTLTFGANVDSRLENIELRSGTLTSLLQDGGNIYLRWKNVVVNGPCTYNHATTTYYWDDLLGEFYDIVVLDNSSYFAVVTSSIIGVFKNIKSITSDIYTFYIQSGGLISGTFIDITLTTGSCFTMGDYDGYVDGNFENLDITLTNDRCFYVKGINGVFKNIILRGNTTFEHFRATENITGKFENITSLNDSNAYYFTSGGTINAEMKNIDIKSSQTIFVANNDILGNYEDIRVISSASKCFEGSNVNIKLHRFHSEFLLDFMKATNSLLGEYKDIFIQNSSGVSFNVTIGNMGGVYENIRIYGVDGGDRFLTGTVLSGHYKNIEVSGTTANIACFHSGTTFSAILEDVSVTQGSGNPYYVMSSGSDLLGTFSKVTIGNCTELFTSVNGGINCYISDATFLEVDPSIGKILNANNDVRGTFRNIYSGVSQKNFAFSLLGDINMDLENLYLLNVTNGAFSSNVGNVYGKYKNIFLVEADSGMFQATQDLDISLENFTLRNVDLGPSLITSTVDINGTFSNIEIPSGCLQVFNCTGGINGYFKDINIGETGVFGNVFNSGSCSAYIENLHTKNKFNTVFGGRIVNSTIDQTDHAISAFAVYGGAIIEKCKLLGYNPGPPDYGIVTPYGGSPIITHTLLNRPPDSNAIATPYIFYT